MTLNTESDTLQFVKVGGPTEQLTKMYDTSPKRCVPGAVLRAGFKLINWQKIFSMHYWLSRKAKLSMVSCTCIFWYAIYAPLFVSKTKYRCRLEYWKPKYRNSLEYRKKAYGEAFLFTKYRKNLVTGITEFFLSNFYYPFFKHSSSFHKIPWCFLKIAWVCSPVLEVFLQTPP